jgi:hypothetical protein
VEQQVILGDALTQLDDLGIHAVEANTLVAVLAEDQRLAVFQLDRGLGLGLAIGGVVERAVVEDIAVLVNLDERGTTVLGGALQHRAQVLDVCIDRTGDERPFATDRD